MNNIKLKASQRNAGYMCVDKEKEWVSERDASKSNLISIKHLFVWVDFVFFSGEMRMIKCL